MKAEPSWLIPLKPIENVELFIVQEMVKNQFFQKPQILFGLRKNVLKKQI